MMSRCVQTQPREFQPRRMYAEFVTDFDERAELIDREDVLNTIGQTLRDVACLIAKGFRGVATFPTTETIL